MPQPKPIDEEETELLDVVSLISLHAILQSHPNMPKDIVVKNTFDIAELWVAERDYRRTQP